MKGIHKITLKTLNVCLLALSLIFVQSCIEEDENAVEGKGPNFVRVIASEDEDSGINITASAFDASPGTSTLIEIRRDPNSNSQLNKPATLKFQIDNTIVDDYNAYIDEYNAYVTEYNLDLDEDNDGIDELEPLEYMDNHVILDSDLYSIESFTVDFAAGELVKYIPMTLNPSSLSFTTKYSLGIRFTEVPSGYVATHEGDVVLVQVLIKNKYHGTYASKGYFTHPTPTSSREIDRDKDLQTTGPNTVITELGDLGGSGYEMTLEVNEDNTVTIYPEGATPNVDQSWGPNYYDPATKKFYLHYSYNTAAPRIIQEVLTMK